MGARSRTLDPTAVRYGPDGLVPAVVQDAADGRVLMLAWQDAEAIAATLETGEAHFHSRSRGTLWRKGEGSGNTLAVESMELDCDADAVLIRAVPAGPTCHTEARSCFDLEPGAEVKPGAEREASMADAQDFAWLEQLWASSLLEAGVDATARKVAEEATEVVMAAKDDAVAERAGTERPRQELAGELADLLYHSLVLCAERGLPPSEVIETLKQRHGT